LPENPALLQVSSLNSALLGAKVGAFAQRSFSGRGFFSGLLGLVYPLVTLKEELGQALNILTDVLQRRERRL